MNLKIALLSTALSVAAFSTANASVIPLDSLQITIGGIVYFNQTLTDEVPGQEKLFGTFVVDNLPTGFKSGTVYLTEPANQLESDISIIQTLNKKDVSSQNLSDVLTIKVKKLGSDDDHSEHSGDSEDSEDSDRSQRFQLKVFFVSDGASKGALKEFPLLNNSLTLAETGLPQDVSALFGLSTGSIFIQSDDPQISIIGDIRPSVPELSTWMMMLLGFAGIGFVAYRRSLKGTAAIAGA